MYEKWLILGNLITTAYLTGLIWTIQILHYPSFAKISPDVFITFHHFHTKNITRIVALPMLIELGLSLMLVLSNYHYLSIILFIMLVLIWILTFFWAIPLHNRLASGFDLPMIKKLVRMNWFRTIFWSLRLILLFYCGLKILDLL